MSKIQLLYIAGLGRSGSTLVDRLLGEVDGFLSVGELRHIWSRSYREDQLCGCRRNFCDCEIWRSITKRAFPNGLSEEMLDRVIELTYKLSRIRILPLFGTPSIEKDITEYIDTFLRPLYTAIQEEYPGCIIVDSSKIPNYLYILRECEFIDLSVIHIIREPRAVAFSWKRKKIRPEVTGSDVYMPTINPAKTSILWIVFNSLINHLGKRLGEKNYRIVTYEEFANDPYASISSIAKFMNHPSEVSVFTDTHSAVLSENHSVSGNPMRFDTGLITIRSDEQWQSAMGKFDKLVVSFLTYLHRKILRFS